MTTQETQAQGTPNVQEAYAFLPEVYSSGTFAWPISGMQPTLIQDLMAHEHGQAPSLPEEWKGFTPPTQCVCGQPQQARLCTAVEF